MSVPRWSDPQPPAADEFWRCSQLHNFVSSYYSVLATEHNNITGLVAKWYSVGLQILRSGVRSTFRPLFFLYCTLVWVVF